VSETKTKVPALTKRHRQWLASALATPENGAHPDLGRYAEQDFSHGRGGGACERCGLPVGPPHEGDDPCLSDLPGVVNACCGHGWGTGSDATLDNAHVAEDYLARTTTMYRIIAVG
jgi:hypothetical protein